MTFRVITGSTYQGGTKLDGDNPKEGTSHPTDLSARDLSQRNPSPRMQTLPPARNGRDHFSQGGELAPIAQLMERLESLSFTFEALNAGSRTYAAEAVLETLARMERRDLQALAAIEAFASALKTVSQHLAGLRNAVHATAHETAAAMEHIGGRLSLLDSRNGMANDDEQGLALAGIAERLTGIEAKVGEPVIVDNFDYGRLAETLDAIARRVSRIEKKVGEMPAGQAGDQAPATALLETIARRLSRLEQKVDRAPAGEGAADLGPVTSALGTIARRVSRIEKKVDEPAAPAAAPLDVAPIRSALETIARRVSRIENKIDEPAAPPSVELDAGPINEALEAIVQRVAEMERKVDAGADGSSIATCLLIVAERLSRIEAAFAQAPTAPVAAVAETAVPDAVPESVLPAPAAPAETVAPAAPVAIIATEAPPAIIAEHAAELPQDASAAPAESPAGQDRAADEAVGARQRVDLLLEQVFRVLSR